MQVWDTANGTKLFTFEGHEAAIHSICPHQKANIQVLVSFRSFLLSNSSTFFATNTLFWDDSKIFYLFLFQFLFSTATDGKIKAWLYDNMGSRVEYNAPGNACTTLAYSSDATR